MSPEDFLLLGVALLIVLNRLYSSTSLRHWRAAYAVVQGVNLAACVVLFVQRLEGIDPRLDAGIRLFLTAFVTWHIALNFIANGKRVREQQREQRREEAAEEAAQDLAEIAANDSSEDSD